MADVIMDFMAALFALPCRKMTLNGIGTSMKDMSCLRLKL